jgi:hypothetical protein
MMLMLLLGVLALMPAAAAAPSTSALERAVGWLGWHGGDVVFQRDSPTTDLYALVVRPGADNAFLEQVLTVFGRAHACRSDRELVIGVFDDEASAVHFGRTLLGAIVDVHSDQLDFERHWLASWSSSQWFPNGPRRPYGWVGPLGRGSAVEAQIGAELDECRDFGGLPSG